ncbi:MAG: hypothetical protein PHY42_01605 [Bacilli bacterium]|nr:hypothetical protein [Bacilli bacterium]
MQTELTFWQKLWRIIGLIFSKIIKFLNYIKFMFTIPLVGMAATVFTVVILLLGKTILALILPVWLQIGLIETLISTIIFLVIMVALYRDKLNHKRGFDPERETIEILASALFWAIPMYFIGQFLSDYLGEFIATMSLSDLLIEPIESIFVLASYAIYSPHMWLSSITGDFGLSMIGAFVLNMGIFALICYRDVKQTQVNP